MRYAVTYKTPLDFAESTLYIDASSEDGAREVFNNVFNQFKQFSNSKIIPEIIKIVEVRK